MQELPIERIIRLNNQRGILSPERIKQFAIGVQRINELKEQFGLRTTDNRQAYKRKLESSKPATTKVMTDQLRRTAAYLRQRNQLAAINGGA